MKYYIDCFFTLMFYTGFLFYSLLWFIIVKLGLDLNWLLLLNTLTAVFIYFTVCYRLFGYGTSLYYLFEILIVLYIDIPLWYFFKIIIPNTTHIFPLSYQTICILSSVFYTIVTVVILLFKNTFSLKKNKIKKFD
ncbi:hypothetical protein ATF84_1237 [[Clostridium] innocuum]|nr:hypothetical protein ATF84_1237 [[Clostridium] innocuum]SSA48952.1 hypothetical protein SAMN04487929_1237 [[Clostridium] innocuum]